MIEGFDNLPKTFGVYIFKDKNKKILYVGKAINLKVRVSSYFNKSILDPKTNALVQKIFKIEHITVENELEALILEADLIKRYKPPYNIALKDDKYYQYIKIYTDKILLDGEEVKVKRIKTTRKKVSDNGKYFGPYPKTTSIHIIIRYLRKIFPYMNCSKTKFKKYNKAQRPCIYGQIGLCPKPCIDKDAIKTSNKNINNIMLYLSGKKVMVFKQLETKMKKLSKEKKYEEAIILRDQLKSYKYLTQNIRDAKEYTQSPNIQKDEAINDLKKLVKLLKDNGLEIDNKNIKDFRIEVYDISNFQGSFAVGSMVVSINGVQDVSKYRKFKIRTKDTPDDFLMLKEVLKRRFSKHSTIKDHPDLIVIDGGKGQLSSVNEILKEISIQIPIIGLAKKKETIIIQTNDSFKSVVLDKADKASNILIRGRNEAHRFAITYYRHLHRKALIGK